MTNQHLRSHLTRVGFNLQLATSQVRAMVGIAESRARDAGGSESHGLLDAWFVQGARGLGRRGLIVHHYPPVSWTGTEAEFKASQSRSSSPIHAFYEFTDAGEAVIVLLRESGLYADVLLEIEHRLGMKAAMV